MRGGRRHGTSDRAWLYGAWGQEPRRWKDYAAKILGLEVVEEGEKGRCYFRMDNWHHRFIVDEDGTDDLNFLGFRVAGLVEFRQMHKHLTDKGIEVRIGSDKEAAERRVLEVMKLKDSSGFPIEIFHGPQVQADKPFTPAAACTENSKPVTADLAI